MYKQDAHHNHTETKHLLSAKACAEHFINISISEAIINAFYFVILHPNFKITCRK